MFLLNCLIGALILSIGISLIFMLDIKTPLKKQVFYFILSLVLLAVVILLFNLTGVIRLW